MLYYKILNDPITKLYMILLIIIQNNILLSLLFKFITFIYQSLLFKISIYIYLQLKISFLY